MPQVYILLAIITLSFHGVSQSSARKPQCMLSLYVYEHLYPFVASSICIGTGPSRIRWYCVHALPMPWCLSNVIAGWFAALSVGRSIFVH